ncbi:MAG TPA: hypothetical protein VGF77_05610 [Allosphingosinicella sp.]|jgi:hypothetical protein
MSDDGLCGFGEPALAPALAAPEPVGMVDGRSIAGFWMPYWASRSYPMAAHPVPGRCILGRGCRG